MKELLALKAEYKQVTGHDYKPGAALAPAPAPVQSNPAPTATSGSGMYEHVTQQGDLVRKLKTEKAPKVRPTGRDDRLAYIRHALDKILNGHHACSIAAFLSAEILYFII